MSSFLKASSFALALLLLSAALPASVQAQFQLHPVYTYGRFQIGNGLPIPITFLPPPRDRLDIPATVPFGSATVMQGTGSPPTLSIPSAVLTAPGNLVNVPVLLANPAVFQVATSFVLNWPPAGGGTVTFKAGGRVGPATVTWCPGFPLPTASYNPSCTAPSAGTPKGLLKYTKTTNQFGGAGVGGGPGKAIIAGKANVAFAAAFSPGCPGLAGCLAAFNNAYGVAPGAIGNTWGVVGVSTPVPVIPGVFPVNVTAMGAVTKVYTAYGAGTGPTNAATSFAGPWTTGMLTASVTNAKGLPEVFVRTGSDMRDASGVGGITLISSSVSDRTISGPNANRGWMRLYVPEPSAALGAAGALLALVTCHGLVRRRSR